MTRHLIRQIRTSSSLLALLTLALSGCPHKDDGERAHKDDKQGEVLELTAAQVAEAKIAVAPVQDQDVGGAIVTTGKVTFSDLHVSHVYSPVTGRVTQIHANPGQRIKKGAPLVTILSPDVGSAFSDLGKAQADAVAAEHDFKRKKDLLEAHAGSQHDLEQAEDVYRKLLGEHSDVGLATVYRVLTQFEQAGILVRHHFEGGKAVYELNQGGHHDHLVCLQCGRVEEFYDSEIEKRQAKVAKERGFAIHDHQLHLYADCIKAQCPHRPKE